MRRKAIIICAPGTKGQKGYLEGALADVQLWKEYLTSLAGGEWYSPEITTLINESKSVVMQHLNNCFADYAFIAFSGHGFVYAADGLTYCKLREGEFISERELSPKNVLKQTISIDACREVTSPAQFILEAFEKGERTAMIGERKRVTTRGIFDNYLIHCVAGVTWLFGADKNQEAGEDGSGGFYTQSIIEGGAGFSQMRGKGPDVLDVYDALLSSQRIITKHTRVQNPTIKVGRRNIYFPFAVRLYYPSL